MQLLNPVANLDLHIVGIGTTRNIVFTGARTFTLAAENISKDKWVYVYVVPEAVWTIAVVDAFLFGNSPNQNTAGAIVHHPIWGPFRAILRTDEKLYAAVTTLAIVNATVTTYPIRPSKELISEM